ncbi:MAG: SBBP repeat-containing protein [Blastocatellales bacterium]
MFTHKRYADFFSSRLIIIVFAAAVLAGFAATVSWRKLSVSASSDASLKTSGAETGSSANQDSGQGSEAAAKARAKQGYGRLPMNFELNQGQAHESVRFLSRGHGYHVFLTDGEAALVLQNVKSDEAKNSGASNFSEGNPQPASLPWSGDSQPSVLRIKPVGARAAKQVSGLNLLPTKSNYLIGNDSSKWHTDIPNYARVEYSEVYPGINMAFYGTQQALEYDFIVAPGADPDSITLSIEGADKIELDDNGDLVLSVAGEKVYHRSPLTYQDDRSAAGARRQVNSRYVLKGGNQIGFAVESYDASRPLVIDPVVDFSTFFGGIGSDEGFAIAVDGSGNAYITGTTYSNNFNTFAPLQTINRGGKFDAFVTKINAAGNGIIYSTYLGGGAEDAGRGIAVDSSGNAYVAGITNSNDFNIRNAFQPTITGLTEDAFIAKISNDGANLLFSSYLGGSNIDQAFAIALDSAGDAYITGSTASADFKTVNPIQPNYRGGFDAFVSKVKGDGSQLIYSTWLGGALFDEAYGIAVDALGNAYVAGTTSSTDFNTINAMQTNNAGNADAFVTKINAQGSALTYSTYVGGSKLDVAYDIAVDVNRNAYITGHTFSDDYPTHNALQDVNRGNADAFVTRISSSGGAFVYSTYLGGTQGDFGRGIAVDSNLNACITGRTASTNFPTSNALQLSNRGNLDAFVAKLNLTGSQLVYATYLGGAEDDLGFGIAVDVDGNAYVTGDTRSTDFNTKNPLQSSNRGGVDAFVSKLNTTGSALTYSTYLGGSGEDLGLGIALDISGNAYITGYTSSNDYATQSPIQAVSKGGLEVFVTKIFADASSIAFNTYFGGNGSDVGAAIAVDSSGSCYVTGATTSTNLPTRTPFQPNNRGSNDAFVAKFNAAGSNIVYSTYLGGTFGDQGRGIAVDLAGSAFITGVTFSDDFTTASAFQPTNRGLGDAFVARVNAAGTALTYSSYLGGAGTDEGAGIAIDSTGNAYVVGNTASGDFNTKSPLQLNNRGQQDVFVTKVNFDGSSLIYSTYLGGQRNDIGNAIAVDASNIAYITGSTASLNFPTQSPLQGTYGGSDFDAFVTKINAAGSALLYSSYLGGSVIEVGNAIAVDSFGNIYVTGVTNSTDFPLQNPIQTTNRGGNDAFITKLNSSGSALIYSTYLGGGNDDRGSGLAVNSIGTAYVTGATSSPDFNIQFPLVAYGGGSDVFVAKLISEASLALSPSTLELQPQETANMSVILSAPQGAPVTVTLTSSNTNIATVPPSVIVQAGQVSADFTVTAVAAGGPVTITAAMPQAQGGATATATVNVIISNRLIQAPSVSVASGGLLTMPIELVSQGNENRLSFSVSLNPALLLNPQFTLGSDATSATLNTNPSQAAQGRFGVTINLPAGEKFSPGARQILVLNAVVLSGLNSTTITTVSFTSTPTLQRVADVNGQTLSASYSPGTVTIAQGYEGDVSPRPGGSNGTVTIADWVQTGRFAAGFDTAAAGGEFQRADTAPRSTLGNGAITISDWVQTGRYSAGLDPVVPAGGPTVPAAALRTVDCGLRIADCDPSLSANRRTSFTNPQSSILNQQSRAVRVVSASAQRGQQVVVGLEIDALGNENALGFSLNFNPNDLTFVSIAAGADIAGATFNPNTMQTAAGRIAVAIALGTNQTFSAGTKKLITLTFTLPSNGTANTMPITFGDLPVVREVVSVNADVLQTAWTSGSVAIPRSVATVSAASFLGAELASEQIVAAFGTSLATTTQIASTLPLPTNLAGTTVRVRDSQGADRPAPLFFVAPSQVNYQIPPGTSTGVATVTITSGDGSVSTGNVTITNVAPGLFTANASGQGVAAAVALRIKADGTQVYEPIASFDATLSRFVPVPIDLGPSGDQVFLILYGVGFRNAPNTDGNSDNGSAENVVVAVDGVNTPALYSGPAPGFVGLDQCNIGPIPRSLAGRGEVDLVLTVTGKNANTVKVSIR